MTNSNHIKNWTCVGKIIGPHGVTGGLKIKSFCENPCAIKNYNPIKVEGYPKALTFTIISSLNDTLHVKSEKIQGRNNALALKGKLLFADRKKLPKTDEDEYYFTDILGLTVKDSANQPFGKITNIADYGAGTFVEISSNLTSEKILIPFTKESIPVIKLNEKYVILNEVSD